nr:hypothetical protein [Shewanella sp. PS-2]
MATRFILRSRLLTEHHDTFIKPSPCIKRIKLPLNEQIFRACDVSGLFLQQFGWLLCKAKSVLCSYST